MSTSEFTFTHTDINSKFQVSVNENTYMVDFLYIDYLRVKQYTASYAFNEPIFNNIVSHFIKDTFEDLMNSHAYEIKEQSDNELVICFKYKLLKRDLPLIAELKTKPFEGNEQLLADNKKLLNEVRALNSKLDNMYFSETYTFEEIKIRHMKDFYDIYHEFLLKHCDLYATEYKITTEKSYVDFIKNRLLDHLQYSHNYKHHTLAIKLYECKHGKNTNCDFNCKGTEHRCVHMTSSSYACQQDEKNCVMRYRYGTESTMVNIESYHPYYNNLLLTFLSINGYNVWFGSGCYHAFTRTPHKFYYHNDIPMKGFKLGQKVSLNIPYYHYPVQIIENIEN